MKILSSFLLILVGTMIFGIPSQSYADPQLDTLLNIAIQARDNLSITISQISNAHDEISQLYNQGSNETDQLAQAVSKQDVNSAKQHFLAAMKFFKQTNDKINSLNATAPNDQQKTEIMQLRGEIVKLENMISLLKSIALQNNANINFTSFDEMIQNTNQDLNSGNLDDASKQIQSANDFVAETHNSLTNIAKERISERAKDFTEKQIAQLNNESQSNNTTKLNVTQNTVHINSSTNSPIANNSNVTVTSNPKDMVAELKQLVSEGKVDQAINLIKKIQAYQKAQLAEKSIVVYQSTNSTVPNTTPPIPPKPTPPLPPSLTLHANTTALEQNTGHNDHGKIHDEHTKPEKGHQHQN